MARIRLKSEGQRQLLEKTLTRGVAAALARECKKDPAFVSNWRLKGAKPETSSRLVIRDFLDIELEAFDQEPKMEFWEEPAAPANDAESEAS